MGRSILACSIAMAALLAFAYFPERSAACGGCFGPSGQPTVVTGHRMAIAISPAETTLWDQFEYAGSPEDFVWVLPVSGGQDVQIELADADFFESLARESQITLQAPAPPGAGMGGGGFGCGDVAYDGASASEPAYPNVTIYGREVVGPYETVTIGSEDVDALANWLDEHGYALPDALRPTIAYYVDQAMNFVVLRLAPGNGVQNMQPVRVTTPGMHLAFPLRMVAAGVADSVALELFVLAEGRYEAGNLGNVEIDRNAITYDWATNLFNYDALADAALAEDGGHVWLTEYASPAYGSAAGQQIYDPDTGSSRRLGGVGDWEVVRRHLSAPYLTRMRAELPLAALADDLLLSASPGADLDGFIQVQNDVNRSAAGLSSPPRIGTASAAPPLPFALIITGVGLLFLLTRRARTQRE